MKNILPDKISKEQSKDTGLALILLANLFGLVLHLPILYKLAIGLIVITMVFPVFFKPVAYLWFGLSNILGRISSNTLLTIIFMLVVLPVGVFRRIIGKDSFYLRKWKNNSKSVFKIRDHVYTTDDIKNPY